MPSSPLQTLNKHLAAARLDLAQKDVKAGALAVFREPVNTAVETQLVRRALEEVWAAAAGQPSRGKKLTIADPLAIQRQWDWLLDQGVPPLRPAEGLDLVLTMASRESPMLSAADWLIDHGMLHLSDLRNTPVLLVQAVHQASDDALVWLLSKGVPADPEPVLTGPHVPPPLWEALFMHVDRADSKVALLLKAGASLRQGARGATDLPTAPLVVLALRQAAHHGLNPSLDWSGFFTVADRLVAAGADPAAKDASGVSAIEALKGTPAEGMWVARRRAEQAPQAPVSKSRHRSRV